VSSELVYERFTAMMQRVLAGASGGS